MNAGRAESKYPLASRSVFRKKFKDGAIQLIGTGLGHHIYQTTAVVAEFRVRVGGEYAKLSNGIEVRYHGSGRSNALNDAGAVENKAICAFSPTAD